MMRYAIGGERLLLAIGVVVCALFMSLGTVAIAGTGNVELEPVEGLFSGGPSSPYELAVWESLLREHSERTCQLLVLPFRDTEWVVYLIRNKNGVPTLIFKRFVRHLGAEMLDTIEKADRKALTRGQTPAEEARALAKLTKRVERRETSLSPQTADGIEKLWATMLARVRYPEPSPPGLDGDNYYIAHWQWRVGYRSGTVWSPAADSNVGHFISIGKDLRALTLAEEKNRASLEAAILEKVVALLGGLTK